MSVASIKIPAAVVTGVVGLLLGAAMGVLTMTAIAPFDSTAAAKSGEGDSGKGAPPRRSNADLKGGKGKGGGGFTPSPKTQLVQLVGKLDVLTATKPLAIELTTQQKQELKAQLAGIEAKDELSDDEAKAKLDSLLQSFEPCRETLEAIGYRWPSQGGGGGGGGGGALANPFKTDENAKHLKALQEKAGK